MTDGNEVFNVVSEYSDQEAVNDSVLYDTTKLTSKPIMLNGKPVNRITATIMDEFDAAVRATNDRPDLHQVVLDTITIYMLQELSEQAKDEDGDGFLLSVCGNDDNAVWFVANEVGGYTMMRPSDY